MKLADKKKLFAILWVDDWTSFPLADKDIRWYHENAGPLSLGLEMDERIPPPYKRQFEQFKENGTGEASDYMSHHYHPVRWKANRFIKKLYDVLHLRRLAFSLVRFIKVEQQTQNLRKMIKRKKYSVSFFLSLVLGVAAFLGVGFLLYSLHWAALAAFLSLAGISAALAFIVFYVHMPQHWDYLFSDWNFNETYFRRLKQTLNDRGIDYPVVLRHGWCSPPSLSMLFYLKGMGALADASSSPTPQDEKSGKGSRKLYWRLSEPYYASITGDYDVSWTGADEEDRGMVELPANLGNVAEYGFDSFAKKRIEQVPDGGLVSTYMHGWDDFKPIKEWVTYLKNNYEVVFVGADRYTRHFMMNHPRPVLVDDHFKAYWAVQCDGLLHPIAGVHSDTVRVEVISRDNGCSDVLLTVNTARPVPVICFKSQRVVVLDNSRLAEGNGEMKDVPNGTYHIQLGPITEAIKI